MIVDVESDKKVAGILRDNFHSLIVFIFYSQWSQESEQYVKSIESTLSLFGPYENVKFFSLCAEKCPLSYSQYKIEIAPTVIFTKGSKQIIAKIDNEIAASMLEKLEQQIQVFKENQAKEKQKWFAKIQSILTTCSFIIFIKGTPQSPLCGFSSKLINILEKFRVEYTYYDIIADEHLANWLKLYSNWPTYPQVYIKGKLIGGIDVITSLIEARKFEEMIPLSVTKIEAKQKFDQILTETSIVAFIDGFTFQNSKSKALVDRLKQKHLDFSIFNTRIDESIGKYLMELGYKIPCVFENRVLLAD